ncbi:MAG: transcription-repair coupling factor [Burkholderiaceae bacterium]
MAFGFTPAFYWQPGHKLNLARPMGSGDAWLLASLATAARGKAQLLVLVCAQAADANRLAQEIAVFDASLRLAILPDWETLPYETFSPHQDLVSERLATLYAALNRNLDVLLVAAPTALQRLAPPAHLAGQTFFFEQGQTLDAQKLKTQLTVAGYQNVSQVMAPGEYAIRGGLIDLFPTGSALPYRLDLFGDEIESIKTFNVDSQRSLYPVKTVRLLPGREFPLDEPARAAFRTRWRERIDGDPTRSTVYRDVSNGVASAGVEYYLPLFFDAASTLFDYLPTAGDDIVVVHHGEVDQSLQAFWTDLENRYRFLSKDVERPILPPGDLYLKPDDYFNLINTRARINLTQAAAALPVEPLSATVPALPISRRADDPLAPLRQFVTMPGRRSILLAESDGRRETLLQLLTEFGLRPQVFDSMGAFELGDASFGLGTASLDNGFMLQTGASASVAFLTEAELFGGASVRRKGRRGQERPSNVDAMIRDLAELKVNDPVVHQQHGIGRYLGLEVMDLGEGPAEFLHLEYAGGANLYVPVAQLHMIARYSGADPDNAPLHSLGSGQWDKARKKAAQQVRDTAAELLNLYARRALREGHSFKIDPADYAVFAESFGFEETPDQAAAIDAVVQDMTSGRPMDRLVCGDVGFGKTEVALRATFIAALDNKQVVLLAPTTLLAEQHFQTFSDRFSDWPVKVVELSRFRSAKETAENIRLINEGKADIVIGTHKVLSPDIHFPRLGLIIIDEEHRFGVRQKEAMKNLRAEVDVLTLTATPIPRTLSMSMEGIRDFSVIATAPQRRLSIKTFVRREDEGVIREAVLRELKRGGQVYFLHNEVSTIENRRDMLEKLLPEARIGIAHGQMPERELERVMREFYQQRFNVLLCTTIIETGIDIPTANTIVIHRADKFGLAQLHQLRGRVGRSHHQAYAYLLVHNEDGLTKQANQRLEAITAMEDLGSGFYLAMHDLEIRGAGEVLGDHQSGNVHEIGFQLYTDMLNQAIRSLRDGREPDLMAPLATTIDINLRTPALLPEGYCGDVHERLSLYKRLASATDAEALDDLQEEMIDRFGKLPDAAQALIQSHRLRQQAAVVGISKIDASPEQIIVQFIPNPPIEQIKIINLIQKNTHIKLAGPDKLKIVKAMPDFKQRIQVVRDLIHVLKA